MARWLGYLGRYPGTYLVALTFGLLAFGAVANAAGPERRALVIGINDYGGGSGGSAAKKALRSGRVWQNLDGAVGDARAFRDLLAARYGFTPQEIMFLSDAQATRARILGSIDGWLLGDARKGDLRIFYYAGHGSQVTNSKSPEADKKDETLVPADGPRGAPDIRDKELARRFARAANAGVSLTVVLDSCHSGSATRGIQVGKARRLEPLDVDVADGTVAPDPTQAGAIVLAAAQDRELAREVNDHGEPHGAFTLALVQALSSLPPDESLEQVFRKTKAIMQRDGRGQEPDLRGPDARKKLSLVGATPSGAGARATVAARNVAGRDAIALQGGRAEDLSPGCELVSRRRDGAQVRIRITAVTGLSDSMATLVSGPLESIKAGDLFELDKWVAPDRPTLTVWVPPALAPSDWASMERTIAELRKKRTDLTFSTDPTVLAPTHTIFWDGRRWTLRSGDSVVACGRHPSTADLDKALTVTPPDRAGDRTVVYFQIPPPPDLVGALDLGARSHNSAIAVDHDGRGAQYVLAGRLGQGAGEFAWLQLGLTATALRQGSSLPFRGDWIRWGDPGAAATLTEHAVKLGRLRGWLFLENARDSFFPYRIGLLDAAKKVRADGVLEQGEEYQLVMRTEAPLLAPVLPRYIYVFTIDQSGQAQLLFPPGGGGGGENRLPIPSEDGPSREVVLPVRIRIGPPYGTDTYIMLATDEPLADPDVLQFSGVTGARGGAPSPLERLLSRVGRRTRGAQQVAVSTSWSIDRASFHSQPLEGK